MNIEEIFSVKNIGLPVMVRMGENEKGEPIYIYGRYYGRGYDGESTTHDKDYFLVTIITPGGSLIRGGYTHYKLIEEIDSLKKLEEFEKMEKRPYSPYLEKRDNKYYKTFEYKKEPITFEHYPNDWFEENGFFEIDEDIFGNGLSKLFSAKMGKKFYFQKLIALCESNPGPIAYKKSELRRLSVISPIRYAREYSHHITSNYWKKKDYFDTIFKSYPVKIKEDDYLVYFGDYYERKIKLGILENKTFIPNAFNPIQDSSNKDEVEFDNFSYEFISEFINAIITYKLDNRKINITQEDMEIILEKFGLFKQKTKVLRT